MIISELIAALEQVRYDVGGDTYVYLRCGVRTMAVGDDIRTGFMDEDGDPAVQLMGYTVDPLAKAAPKTVTVEIPVALAEAAAKNYTIRDQNYTDLQDACRKALGR